MKTLTKERRFTLACIGIAVVLGLLFRVPYYMVNDFTLGDGGMFAAIIDTIRAGGYAYPDFTGYNHQHIPFAYPPLAFYLAALVTDVLGTGTLTTLTYLPLFLNLLSIAVFVLLATRLLKEKSAVLLTVVIFPLLPGSYEWLIMGGGLTRGAGFLFMLLALYAATYLNFSSLSIRSKPFLGTLAFLSLAAYSHPEAGISTFAALTLLVLMRSYDSGALKTGIVNLAALGIATTVLTAPWWVTVLAKHGSSPFLAASQTSYWSLHNFVQMVATLGIFDLTKAHLVIPAIAGGLVCLFRKKWFLPVWFVLIFLITPRKAPTTSAVPYALLSAVGIYTAASYILERIVSSGIGLRGTGKFVFWLKQKSSFASNYAVMLMLACLAYMAADQLDRSFPSPLSSLTSQEQAAMQWIEKNTPRSADFVVLSPFEQSWATAHPVEWFPYLTKRKSLTTVQGLEWAPDSAFKSTIKRNRKVTFAQYYSNTLPTVESNYASFGYVAFFTPVATFAEEYKPRFEGFATSDRYRLVYSNGACLVFKTMRKEDMAASIH